MRRQTAQRISTPSKNTHQGQASSRCTPRQHACTAPRSLRDQKRLVIACSTIVCAKSVDHFLVLRKKHTRSNLRTMMIRSTWSTHTPSSSGLGMLDDLLARVLYSARYYCMHDRFHDSQMSCLTVLRCLPRLVTHFSTLLLFVALKYVYPFCVFRILRDSAFGSFEKPTERASNSTRQ
jgi:hypothetical protein